ncbi:hypothetical protein jhhlp_005754 [Lomentospora prolificans]|uniref:NAD dependent epimerase/dehydratase n=1 Tax=Lomentospora prolificans TaxID=41688 RepID=A0A2N3N412_9PEZI|nr:hypothetical protein jhhlp_005754 [Lomentospora prolificans]
MAPKTSSGNLAEQVASPRIVPMKVIVCGLMRTGTLSMRAALRQLGIHDVYHMQTTGTNPEDIPHWMRAIDAKYNGIGHFGREDWDMILGTYQATTDVPASFFGTELAAAYPEAKVIILNREREKWYESCLSSIHAAFSSLSLFDKMLIVLFDPTLREFGMFMHKINTQVQGFQWPEKAKALAFFDRYYSEWRTKIPRDRVLEYRVQDGWGPLCEHLGVPVPTVVVDEQVVEAPFPRLNDGASMRAAAQIKMRQMRGRVFRRLAGWAQTAVLVLLVAHVWYTRRSNHGVSEQ